MSTMSEAWALCVFRKLYWYRWEVSKCVATYQEAQNLDALCRSICEVAGKKQHISRLNA